ncbi:hypothetical protein OHA77_13960 [Streptosporangium sp. NBC_01639]|uniref:hypothetical protein n=1 Tax=unclassified Streptosporangium TaxID=2632669 RepID=UPI002DDAC33C|nr:hypothetical protein [Streptosporangium sp. NBC_01756]WSC83797.1 hypothetical protein OIE48_25745 [Streptosporangium sp. NBC_01756]WTD57588.1 hypothetical protein OHA77_13960 [Streptosporangium sp. NBC_01639]
MDSSDGRVLIIIVIATIVFFVGRRFQRTLDAWANWGKALQTVAEAMAKVPDAKAAAWTAIRRMIVVGLGTLILFAAIVNAIRYG